MRAILRVAELEGRLVPSVMIDSAHETYAWVLINALRLDPTGFADRLEGLRSGTISSAFGFSKNDPVITDLNGMIQRATVPGNYGQALALIRSTPAAGPLGWHELLENRAGIHNDWMRVNGLEHTGVNSGNRRAIPGFSRNNTAPADEWGYAGEFSWYGENIGYGVGMLAASKAAFNAGSISLAGLRQRAAFLDTMAYILELNSSSLGHLENLLGRDRGTHSGLPLYNAIGMDIDLYEAPAPYEAQDGVPEGYVSTHRFGLYRPDASGGFLAGVVYTDRSANGFYDIGEAAHVTVEVRRATGTVVTQTLTSEHHGAFSFYLANGTYTVTVVADGIVLDSQSVAITNSNAWAEFRLGLLNRVNLTGPTASPASLRPTVTWDAVPSATSYQVRLDDLSAGTTNIFPSASSTGLEWTPPADLASGRSYRVWVRAMQGPMAGPWSLPRDFTLAIPTRQGPQGGVATLRPEFAWTPIAGATYRIRIDDLTAGLNDIVPSPVITATSWTPSADLVSGRAYRWQVRAVNALGQGYWSSVGHFSIARPTISSPSGLLTDLRPEFSWTPITGAASYEVRLIDTTDGANSLVAQSRVGEPRWTPGVDLISGRNYAWQVRAVNDAGRGLWTNLRSMSVARPTLTAPLGPLRDPRPEFTWTPLRGASHYVLRVTNVTLGVRVVDQTLMTTSWRPDAGLIVGHHYRWWVRAVNDTGRGAWSLIGEFWTV